MTEETPNAVVTPIDDDITALTRNVEYNISFKVPKGTPKDDKGNYIDETGAPFIRRQAFKLVIPAPTLEGVKLALKEEKQREYILDLIAADIYRAARLQVDSDEKPVNSSEELDLNLITLEHIANEPAAERRGAGISKETWEEFSKDYQAIMPDLTSRKPEVIQNQVLIFLKRCQTVKTNKPVLKFLKEQLAMWAVHTDRLEDFTDIVEFLDRKIDLFLSTEDEALLANLM